MSISKLYIFQKQTDATASLTGYRYQVLKAVETWVENFHKEIDDEIYCDFEDDIFQKNQLSQKAKFRQIKLYSTNFSFASEEIKKCIAHFFMLHVKTDYNSFDKEFVFEANTSVAQKRGENDAKLLSDWNEHQEKLDGELLTNCVSKVKTIVSEYVNEQAAALKEKAGEDVINEALEVFNSLTDAQWIEFTKRIRWKFKDIPPDVEFTLLKENIETLILKLPFPIGEKNLAANFGLLHNTAWEKATAKNPDERKLTLAELQEILLQSANEKDNWYWQVFERWKKVESVEHFNIGQFYEVIDATRHCRQHPYLRKHDDLWKSILKIYIDKVKLPDDFRRTAIYEFLWLRFRPINLRKKPAGDLVGENDYFDFYFRDFKAFRNARELEDAQSLMHIALAACFMGNTDLKMETVQSWFKQVEQTLIERIEHETNPNEICHLLENLGTHYLFLNSREEGKKNVEQVITPLGKIFSYLSQADFYNASALCERLNKYIGLLIQVTPEENAALIEAIETYTEKLNPIVAQRHGDYKAAKVEVNKGCEYLKSDKPFFLLKALNCFHKARALWYRQEHIEGYVLALLNISQLYSAIGMNLAAKYYALSASWISVHNGERHLLKRIADAFGLVFYSDFKQGAWMNAIISFDKYMHAYFDFKGTPLDPDIDKMPFKTIADLALVFYAAPKISPQLKVLVDAHIQQIGELADEFIKPLFPGLERDYPTDTSMKDILEGKLTDKPLNDVGKKRFVRFNSLGCSWEVSFSNDYETNLIAEEFCGILQVMLAEIALSKNDFHLAKGSVKIEVELNNDVMSPEQQPTHTEFKWKVFLASFDSTDNDKFRFHMGRTATTLMYILEEISLLKQEEFREKFTSLFKENDLADKTQLRGAYQRMYHTVFSKESFDSLQRQHFEPVDAFFLNLPKTNSIMEWKSSFSSKYNKETAIENIKGRFKNSHQCIYITIEKLKQDKNFHTFINGLRNKGWHDWQIIITIMNFMLNYKTQKEIEGQNFETKELYKEKYNEIFHRLQHTDEKDCYIKFPVEAFHSDEFKFQLNHTLIIILKSYGLENNARHPNFNAVKDFLDIRFNMKNDTTNDGNILAVIEPKT